MNKPAKEYLGHSKEAMAVATRLVQKIAIATHTATQTALQFVLQNQAITSAIVGMSRMAQLIEVAATADKQPLSMTDWKLLQDVLPAKVYEKHR